MKSPIKMVSPWGQEVDIDPIDVPVRKSWGYKEIKIVPKIKKPGKIKK
tara:strand:+ start:4815 stop:4958 length:144 start_codon:yes stop_codon:yes gene_type:complete